MFSLDCTGAAGTAGTAGTTGAAWGKPNGYSWKTEQN